MKSYDEKATCPKCGGADISARYEDGNLGCPYGLCWTPVVDWTVHIHRTCRQCKYEWLEAPLEVFTNL